jgi:hypothetical protein
MERIKEALETAREQRKQEITIDRGFALHKRSVGSKLGNSRILEREPFRDYSSTQQQSLVESSRVLNVSVGETLQFSGDKDDHVHYLIAGAVALESEQSPTTTIAAERDVARHPLDGPGLKEHTIVATTDAEILRVPISAVPKLVSEADVAPGPRPVSEDDVAPVPKAAYTETYSGQQLADLVDQINSENDDLQGDRNGATRIDPAAILANGNAEESLSELSASADSLIGEIAVDTQTSHDLDETAYLPQQDDEIGQFTRELELRFRHYVERVKTTERARYEAQLQTHATNLKEMAEVQLRAALIAQSSKTRKAYAEKDRRLRERYKNLKEFANKITRQKAAIYVARRQISDKLRLVERIHGELAQLGSQLDNQLDNLDEQVSDAGQMANAPGDR